MPARALDRLDDDADDLAAIAPQAVLDQRERSTAASFSPAGASASIAGNGSCRLPGAKP
jgi:hypothetical protein